MMRRIMGLLSIASLLVSATYLHAQGYPNQPISLVLPYAPGDTGDVAGRAMAEELAKMLKVSVVPVNRPGAGAVTRLGADYRSRRSRAASAAAAAWTAPTSNPAGRRAGSPAGGG